MEFEPKFRSQVNLKSTPAQIVAQDAEVVLAGLRQLRTAGTSEAIIEPYTLDPQAASNTIYLEGPGSSNPWLAGGSFGETWPYSEFVPGNAEPNISDTIVFGVTSPLHYIAGLVPAFQPVNVEPLTAYRRVRDHAKATREAALSDIRRRLDAARAAYAQKSPRDVVTELRDELGVGQLVIGRAIGVTPTAVRKWRQGEPPRPEHRDSVSKLAALLSLLGEVGVHDPASWIEIPISAEGTLTPVDLFSRGRSDLVALFASGLSEPQELLDMFDANWRDIFAHDRDYEVVQLADGSRAVVPRRGASN